MSKPAAKQALKPKAPPADSLTPEAGSAALPAVALVEAGAPRDFFIDLQQTEESSKWKVQSSK